MELRSIGSIGKKPVIAVDLTRFIVSPWLNVLKNEAVKLPVLKGGACGASAGPRSRGRK